MSSEQDHGAEDKATQRLGTRLQIAGFVLASLSVLGALGAWLYDRLAQGDQLIAITLLFLGVIIFATFAAILISEVWRNRSQGAFWRSYSPYVMILILLAIVLTGVAVSLFLPAAQPASPPPNITPTAIPTLTPQPTDTLTTTVVGGATPTMTIPATVPVAVSPAAVISAVADIPLFDIVALNTLDGDPNAYEVTDWLISAADNLAAGNLVAAYPIQVTPRYSGTAHFRDVVALVDGDGDRGPITIPLWDELTSVSESVIFTLTLREIVDASGIDLSYPGYDNLFADGAMRLQTADLTVKVVSTVDQDVESATQVIRIRNAPWEFQGNLVQRDGKQYIDSSIHNLGGTGLFTVIYNVRKELGQIDSDTHPMYASTELVAYWSAPDPTVEIPNNGYYTASVMMPTHSGPGIYVVESFPIKRQPSISLLDQDTDWAEVYAYNGWQLAGQYKSNIEFFVYNPFAVEYGLIGDEHLRLRKENGIDLGLGLSQRETIISPTGMSADRQIFQSGEIIAHDGAAYSLYGPLLEHYRAWVQPGSEIAKYVGFPISQTQTVTSATGVTATVMTFEDKDYPATPAAIYATAQGAAGIRAGFQKKYLDQGGHAGALGLPVADEEYYADCLLQRFERGYLVYPTPRTADGNPDLRAELAVFPAGRARGGAQDCPPGDAAIAYEWLRLYEDGHDLGFAIAPTATITSASGLAGYRQEFDDGEIVVYDGQVYGVYGEIYRHYKQVVEGDNGWPFYNRPLLPVTAVQDIEDGGQMIEFEGQSADAPRIVIYATRYGVALLYGEILEQYESEGGALGWPLADRFYFPYGNIQAFHRGYITLPSPLAEGTEYDYSQQAITFPYRGASNLMVAVAADRGWQDAGVWLRAGDTITVEQLAGAWTHAPAAPLYTAAGAPITTTDDVLPLPSASVGALLGWLGSGPPVVLGDLGAITADRDARLLLKMNDFDYRDNAGTVTVEIHAPRPTTPLQILRFDFQDSPLARGHGWTLEDETQSAVTFAPTDDEFVGPALRIRATDTYGIDHTANDLAHRRGDTLEVVAALEANGILYAEVGLKDDGAQSCPLDAGWLKFRAIGDAAPEQVSDHEWSISVAPVAELGGEWRRYQIDLDDAVARSFGQQGCTFAGLQSYRLRGDMDIERIAAYDRQP